MPKRTNPFQQVIASLVDLLENGSVVTESIEYPDPAAGNPREVDITVVRGQLDGNQLRIGIECTDQGRKATQPWVEMQYGKHSRLQVVDFVVLVSDSGFTKTAKVVAEQLGYLAIHPNIAESELAAAIGKLLGSVSVKAASLRILKCDINFTHGLEGDCTPTADGADLWFLRTDGSPLVNAVEFERTAAMSELAKNSWAHFRVEEAYKKQFTVELDSPTHEGEHLHIMVTDGQSQALASVDRLVITASLFATNTAKPELTHMGNYGGHTFATGSAPIGDTEAVYVATDVGGVGKSQIRFNFDAHKGHDAGEQQKAPKKCRKKG